MQKIVLSLCDESAAWSGMYAENGYDVRQIDKAFGDDARLLEFIDRPVHGILAAPPCTHLSGAGADQWYTKGIEPLLEGLAIVDACLRAVAIYNPAWWCLENPQGRLSRYLGPPQLVFQPWEYGDPWTKRTCLWGRFQVPEKCPVQPTRSLMDTVRGPKLRSVTPPGFARAFYIANP